jgi:hypothetical protein
MRIAKSMKVLSFITLSLSLLVAPVFAANTTLTQEITGGLLSVEIVDGGYTPVGSPSVAFPSTSVEVLCQTSNATLGTGSQRIYVQNPGSGSANWNLTIAGSATTALWTSGGNNYDFNDVSGCTDGVDADSVGGQLSINADAGTLANGECVSCNTTNVTKGTASAFVEGTTNSITLLNATATSTDIADYVLTGVALSQSIPAGQPAGNYSIGMVLTVTAY